MSFPRIREESEVPLFFVIPGSSIPCQQKLDLKFTLLSALYITLLYALLFFDREAV